ncbi:SAM-dependent methyltransferase [Streptomyces spectabilis]|uniref:Methyltransferase domain-containing protein n=1 Tax=Streptomyces spectabilis TaxID=68270 RepID=A0A516R716_STRST|nr:methyltransferase domain-containing protein [Streptomyces spectabilis]QDQ11449.1 methyltransferase domain-containing protein [Streptomyces spectabilis]
MTRTGDVGDYYDLLTPLLQQLWGGNFHIGLWPDRATPAENADRDDRLAETDTASDRLTDLLVEELALAPGQRLLDVGCGVGRPALRLARSTGARVTGITISSSQVRLATDHARAAGLDHLVGFQLADAVALPFPAGSYDAAWAIESLLHIPDTRRALTEIHRILAPGGPFVISDMILRAPDPEPHAHSAVEPLETLLSLLEETGFEVTGHTDLDDHLLRSLQRLGTDLDHHRKHVADADGPAADALARILGKTIPAVGTVYGYTVITTSATRTTR